MMQEVEVLKTIPELVCSYFSEEQFTLSVVKMMLTKALSFDIIYQVKKSNEIFHEGVVGAKV